MRQFDEEERNYERTDRTAERPRGMGALKDWFTVSMSFPQTDRVRLTSCIYIIRLNSYRDVEKDGASGFNFRQLIAD